MDVLGIDYTFFAVSEMEKSLTFYRDTLGMPLAGLAHEGKWAEFHINPGTLALGEGEEFTQPGGGMVALAVENVEDAVEELEQAGIPIVLGVGESSVCYWAVIEDPDQNRIIIHQRKDKSVG
ncbi:VOC family protein [Candidatus Poribacteria bacterium]|nr:VOC family protein [Candidatus Poribacteria bacterium]